MAECLEVITNALVLRKIIGIGKSPKAAETALGLTALQSLYDQWRTGGMFGQLEDVYLEEDETALEGKRYFVPTGLTLTDASSVYEDENGVTRQPRDLAMYESLTQAGVHTAKLYDRKEWVDLLGLELTDVAPLSSRTALGLAACLATSGGFAAAFGGEASPELIALARHFLRNVMGKDATTQDRTGADYY
jgi:hypothetical protein